jgi:hypothetical protein
VESASDCITVRIDSALEFDPNYGTAKTDTQPYTGTTGPGQLTVLRFDSQVPTGTRLFFIQTE